MPRKTVQQQKTTKNRISPLVKKLIGTESSDDLMRELIKILPKTNEPPKVGKFYIFSYNAKTSGIRYDENPLVAVTEVFKWGFKGINFHWGESRQYTWDEIAGGIYEVYDTELEDLRRLPFSNIRTK
jgi:hypothetical protein